VSGGRTYDAVIAACALRARVTTLLTFDEEHFAAYADRGLEIVVP
jgi:predicted nucleic acid-binding protein